MTSSSSDGSVWLRDTRPFAATALCATIGEPLTWAEWNSHIPGLPYASPWPG